MDWLEARTLLSTLDIDASGNLTYLEATSPGSPNVLTVSTTGPAGDYTFNDSLQTITLGPGAITDGWMGNGTNTVTGPDSSVKSIAITKAGGDTVNVESVNALTTITPGSGTNTVNIGNAGSLAGIQAAVSVVTTGGSVLLNIDDSSDAASRTFNVSTTEVTSDALVNPIGFSGSGVLTIGIKGGTGNDNFNVSGFGTGNLLGYTIDGGTGTNTMNLNSSVASLIYSGPGQIVAAPFILQYANLTSIHITEPAAAPVGAAATIKATEGLAFTNSVVATFTDSDLGVTPSDFAASINWGDGTAASAGVIAANGTTNFEVLGSHAYATTGTYTVNVTLTDLGSTSSTVVSGTTISVATLGPVASVPNPIASTATVAAAPLTAQGVPISGYEGLPVGDFPVPGTPPPDVLVATFMDTGTAGAPSAYTASINWGDGTTTADTRIVATGTANGTVFSVYGTHTYASFGSYPVITTITKSSGAAAIAASTATITDAPLTANSPPPVTATEGVYFNGTVASFADPDPSSNPSDFRVAIDWGDGSPESAGYLVASPGVGTIQYTVHGSHTYADSLPAGAPGTGLPGPQTGSYPISVSITETGGAALNLTNNATVNDVALTLTGKLNPASDSGISNSDDITNVTQPNFLGTTSEPDAKVVLYATLTGSTTPILLGQTASDGNDAWSITSGIALADGSYTITAQATDSSGHTISNLTTVTSNLVIDTAGPKVTNIYFDRIHGQVLITYQDYGGVGNAGVGLNQSTLVDANNYAFSLIYSPFNPKHVPRFLVTSVTVSPGTETGQQVATVVINNGKYLRGGHFLFTARSVSPTDLSGIQDIAGNALDGEFYGYFPSGNNHPGGDFVAEIDAEHHKVYAPRTVIGTATPVSPPGTPGTSSTIPTYHPGKTSPGSTAVKLASKHTGNTATKPVSTTATKKVSTTVARTNLVHLRTTTPVKSH